MILFKNKKFFNFHHKLFFTSHLYFCFLPISLVPFYKMLGSKKIQLRHRIKKSCQNTSICNNYVHKKKEILQYLLRIYRRILKDLEDNIRYKFYPNSDKESTILLCILFIEYPCTYF